MSAIEKLEILIEAFISLEPRIVDVAKDAALILTSGKVAKITVSEYDEVEEKKSAAKIRSIKQNRLIYKSYQRIGKTLYGGDESLARNECKLRIGCRILYRDSKDFAVVFDSIIRPLDYDKKIQAMNLISVSSIMEIPQATEYIKTIFTEYGQRGVYFLDLDGASEYVNYPESRS